jgi:hypothetical protein
MKGLVQRKKSHFEDSSNSVRVMLIRIKLKHHFILLDFVYELLHEGKLAGDTIYSFVFETCFACVSLWKKILGLMIFTPSVQFFDRALNYNRDQDARV